MPVYPPKTREYFIFLTEIPSLPPSDLSLSLSLSFLSLSLSLSLFSL